MRAWRLNHLGGELRLEDTPMPTVRPGGILVRVEASTLMSYMKRYVEGRLQTYHAPEGGFTLTPYPAVRQWLARVAARPGHVEIGD